MSAVYAIPTPPGDADREPPSDVAAEKAIIGAILDNRRAVERVLEAGLAAGDFHRAAHATIYATVCEMADAATPLDPTTVATELEARGDLARVGGRPYLADCYTAAAPSPATAAHHARTITAHAQARALIAAGERITQIGYGLGDIDDRVERAVFTLDQATRPTTATGDLQPMSAYLPEWIDRLSAPDTDPRVPVPYRDLGDYIKGFRPGQLVVIAARPGVGKTTIALDAARRAAIGHGMPVLMHSLEMPREEITARLMAAESTTGLRAILDRTLTDADYGRLATAMGRVADAPLLIDDTPGCTLGHIRGRLRHMARTAPARLLIVDYLGLVETPAQESRQAEVSTIIRGLKRIAREHSVPLLALAQMNRAVEGRASRRPVLSDLRESGQIEAEADVVIFLDRPDASDKETARAGELDLVIAKNRQGPTGEITVSSQMHYGRCVDLAQPGALPY